MVLDRLAPLEARARRVIALCGALDVAAALAGGLALSYLLDRTLELPVLMRVVLSAGIALLWLRLILLGRRRLRAPLEGRELLITLERAAPELQGRLFNALELRDALREARSRGADPLEIGLLERALAESRRALRGIDPRRALDLSPLHVRIARTLATLGAVLLIGSLAPEDFDRWAERNLLFMDRPWPRATHFALEGLPEEPPYAIHHPRGDPLVLEGWVLGRIPDDLFLLVVPPEGGGRRLRILPGEERTLRRPSIHSEIRDGAPPAGAQVRARRLSFRLSSVVEPFRFRFEGGDNRSVEAAVEVHERPRILQTRLAVSPPAYTGIRARSLQDPTGEVRFPAGSRILLEARADRPLREARVRLGNGAEIDCPLDGETAFRFEHDATESTYLEARVRGRAWGFESAPWRIALVALPDEPPSVELKVPGADSPLAPEAEIAAEVRAKDDYGFKSLDLLASRERPPSELLETSAGAGAGLREAERGAAPESVQVFELLEGAAAEETEEGVARRAVKTIALGRDLGAQPGERWYLQARAADNDANAGGKTVYSAAVAITVSAPEAIRERVERVRLAVRASLEELADRERGIARELEGAPGEGPEGESAANREASPRDASGREPREGTGDARERTSPPEAQAAERSESPSGAEGERRAGAEREAPSGARGEPRPRSAEEGRSAAETSRPPAERAGRRRRSEGDASAAPREGGVRPQRRSSGERRPADPERLAEEQRNAARRARELLDTLREAQETLERNRLLDDAARRRLEEEVLQPLEEAAEERLPRSAERLSELAREGGGEREDLERERREVEDLAESLEDIARRLGESDAFEEVLQRLEAVLELQEELIRKTERAGAGGARKSTGDAGGAGASAGKESQ